MLNFHPYTQLSSPKIDCANIQNVSIHSHKDKNLFKKSKEKKTIKHKNVIVGKAGANRKMAHLIFMTIV